MTTTWPPAHLRAPAGVGRDVLAGLVLTAALVPVGMGYAEASGLPPVHGLYATVAALIAYALFGPSPTLVLGPDSTLAAVIAALILPRAAGDPHRAVHLAGALALLHGAFLVILGRLRTGVVADLFSKPIRIGFLNAIALTVITGQTGKLLGMNLPSGDLVATATGIVRGVAAGQAHPASLVIGLASLGIILGLRRWRPRWPGLLLAVVGATATSAVLDLEHTAGVRVLGALPRGLPLPSPPWVSISELAGLIPGAAMLAALSFADTSVLSRALAARRRERVSLDQEMVALGAANIACALTQGFSVSSSASRTPVAEAAGSQSQLTGLTGAAAIVALLLFAPGLLHDLPTPLLAAVVIAASLSFADVRGMVALYGVRRQEFALSVASFLGVTAAGVVPGIGFAVVLAALMLMWNAWHPHFATLVRVEGRSGWHDAARHPEGQAIDGLMLFRWDAQLFFANAEVFHREVIAALDAAPATRRLVVVADAITDVDVTAADALRDLYQELEQRGISLHFAGVKGPVKDRMRRYGLMRELGADRFWSTTGSAIDDFRRHDADQR